MPDIKLIALDMDGTLLASDHSTIPARNITALRAAAERGVHIAIASGRSWSLVRETAQSLGCVSYAITANGAYTLQTATGREIASFPIAPDQAAQIVRILRRWGLSYELYMGPANYMEAAQLEDAAQLGFSPAFMEMFRRNTVLVPDMLTALQSAGVGKFDIFRVPEDRWDQVMEELARTGPLLATSPLGGNLELNAPEVHKGLALAALAGELGLEPGQVMAFGDADNDLGMLSYAHWSFAMENAVAEAKAAARFQTGRNDDGGVGMAVEQYVLG